jgi:hypothetical protein
VPKKKYPYRRGRTEFANVDPEKERQSTEDRKRNKKLLGQRAAAKKKESNESKK